VLVITPAKDDVSGSQPLSGVSKYVSQKLSKVSTAFTASNEIGKKITLGFTDSKTRDEAAAALQSDDFLSAAGYQLKCSNKMLPKLTLHNVQKHVLDEIDTAGLTQDAIRELEKKTLRDLMLSKNSSIKPLVDQGHTFQIVYLRRNTYGKKNLTLGIKVSPAIRSAILEKQYGSIYMEGQGYEVTDRFSVKECYHCQLLGHISTDCPKLKDKKPATCMYCMGQHNSRDCTQKKQYDAHCCARCLASTDPNESVNYRTHNAGDPTCPILARERSRLAAMTDFTSKNVM
jgi:hypothetical protein